MASARLGRSAYAQKGQGGRQGQNSHPNSDSLLVVHYLEPLSSRKTFYHKQPWVAQEFTVLGIVGWLLRRVNAGCRKPAARRAFSVWEWLDRNRGRGPAVVASVVS